MCVLPTPLGPEQDRVLAALDVGAGRDLDTVDIALHRHLLVGVHRRRRVVHQTVAHQGGRRDLARHVLAGLEGSGGQIAQGVEIGEQRRRLTLLQGIETLQAARQKPLVQSLQIGHLRDRHEELATGRLHRRFHLALVVALAGTAEAVAEQVVRLQMAERPGALTRAVAQNARHRRRRVVVQHRERNPAEEGEGADMAVQERLRRLLRIGLHEPDIGMRQDRAEEGHLLAPAPHLDHRLAEVDLGMARRVMQRNEGLARRLAAGPDIVLHDRVAAREPVLVLQPLEDPIRRVPLLARHIRVRVRLQDRVDDAGEALQLRPPHRLRPAIARRRRVAQHLLHCPPVDAEPPARLAVAQTLLDNRKSNRRIELHAVHPPPLATTDKRP